MISDKLLMLEIQQLPENLKLEVFHYINFIKSFRRIPAEESQQLRNRKFGCAKNKYHLSADFDAPLEDFNDYMS